MQLFRWKAEEKRRKTAEHKNCVCHITFMRLHLTDAYENVGNMGKWSQLAAAPQIDSSLLKTFAAHTHTLSPGKFY